MQSSHAPTGHVLGTGSRQRGSTPRQPDHHINLKSFFALAYLLGWGIGVLMVLFQKQVESIFGEISGTNAVFVLVVYSPGIAGVFLVWRHYGFKALGSFFRRATLWRMPAPWWAFLLLGIPAVKLVGAAIGGTIHDPFPYSPWYDVLPALLIALCIGPLGEEFGWRGVALPMLQRRFTPLGASLILGAIWGVWHLPAFLLSGTPQSAWSFGPFFVGVLALGIIVTPLFNASRGSILIPILFHFQMNLPALPDAQPWENYLFAAVAVVVVILNWHAMTTHVGAATGILMPGEEDGNRDDEQHVQQSTATMGALV
jgi:membrane protease YdiL (CAAX protease family)